MRTCSPLSDENQDLLELLAKVRGYRPWIYPGGGATLANVNAILKQSYLGPIVQQLNQQHTLLGTIRKEKHHGTHRP